MAVAQGTIVQGVDTTRRGCRLRDMRISLSQKFPEVTSFLLSRRVENCSPHTILTYEKRILAFFEFVGAIAPTQVTKSDLELYLLHLRDTGVSPHYIQSCYRSIHVFLSWLVAEEIIEKSPMNGMRSPKVPKFAKPFLSEEDYKKLLALCHPKDYRGARSRAWLTLLWTTGARFSELANLKVHDLDWDADRIRVVGKGAKERHIPFTKDAQVAMYRYLAVRPEGYDELWIGEERRPLKPAGLSSATRKLYQRAGIKVTDLHHIFRRSWAYRNLKAGVPIKHLQIIGGWSSVTVLEQYVARMDSEDALSSVKWV